MFCCTLTGFVLAFSTAFGADISSLQTPFQVGTGPKTGGDVEVKNYGGACFIVFSWAILNLPASFFQMKDWNLLRLM